MKRLLFIVPFVLLLLLLNACGGGGSTTDIPATQWTAMWQTEIARGWTATLTPTNNPDVPTMISWLNIDLLATNSLGATIDAEYTVNRITFPNIPNSPELIFRVDVGCICMNSNNCCTSERTFVVIIESMKKHLATVAPIPVPGQVHEIMVVCFDQKTKSQIGAISALWQDVQNYLHQNLDGHHLGVQITRTIAPTP